MTKKTGAVVIAVLAIGAGIYGALEILGPRGEAVASGVCEAHAIQDCPFCDPSLLESMGFCQGHGVPEAVCTRCRGDLEAAFRAENDWCAEHDLPESHCEKCNPGTLQRFATFAGSAALPGRTASPASSPAKCAEHDVLRCPFCDPSLLESMGFCQGHGVPEAVCTRCREDLEAAFRAENDWCAEHGLPDSHCEECNPGTLDRFRKDDQARAESDPAEVELIESDVPRIHRGPSLTCATEATVVRLANAEVANRIGIELTKIRRAPLRRTLSAPAELKYDATRHALLSSRAPGIVVEVRRQLGDRVEAGDVLLAVDSATVGTAKSELLRMAKRSELWEKNLRREQGLLEKSLSTEREVLEAETQLAESNIAIAAAEQRLHNLGFDQLQIQKIRETGDSSTRLELLAPFSGFVVELATVVGQIADPSLPLVAVADTSRIWVLADVDQSGIGEVSVGQPVLLTLEGVSGETYGGRVTWISTEADPRTRTIKVRAELENPHGRLRAKTFGRLRIVTRDGDEALLIPKDAVQWEGCCNVAFAPRSPTEFAPHKLRLGYDAGDHIEVLAGLEGVERVVTQGSFLLKTELQKGSIGAGCCEIDYLGE